MFFYKQHPYGGYKPWKGTESTKIGHVSGFIRPLTKYDDAPMTHGKARPIKHYRRGTMKTSAENPTNRQTNSVGLGLLDQIHMPGGQSVPELPNTCTTNCGNMSFVNDYYANKTYITENPTEQTTNAKWCCNPEKKAIRRTLAANTNIDSSKYFTRLEEYMKNKCITHRQKSFNFKTPDKEEYENNMYRADCNCNNKTDRCSLTAYKPSNSHFAVEGAVDNKTLIMNKKYNTLKMKY